MVHDVVECHRLNRKKWRKNWEQLSATQVHFDLSLQQAYQSPSFHVLTPLCVNKEHFNKSDVYFKKKNHSRRFPSLSVKFQNNVHKYDIIKISYFLVFYSFRSTNN